jgi:hypothetical protein
MLGMVTPFQTDDVQRCMPVSLTSVVSVASVLCHENRRYLRVRLVIAVLVALLSLLGHVAAAQGLGGDAGGRATPRDERRAGSTGSADGDDAHRPVSSRR